ncbi:hypothetical protein [Gordonia sp. N1V]|uniref:hypothetical protein n=1 Tax=Gordonia sp. N1V TaxID=3034163 RepID=UPI0023E1B8C1|nr:hypothetical protein [Gordonia sp. N1V]MDF3283363.1 hypothetical protein [Gordonia sp. N1V]
MPRLLLRDSITVKVGGGTNSDGDPIPQQTIAMRAEAVPISGDEQALRGRMATSVEYRFLVTDKRAEGTTTLVYRGQTFTCQGKWMVYRIGGRVHHLEVVARFGTG